MCAFKGVIREVLTCCLVYMALVAVLVTRISLVNQKVLAAPWYFFPYFSADLVWVTIGVTVFSFGARATSPVVLFCISSFITVAMLHQSFVPTLCSIVKNLDNYQVDWGKIWYRQSRLSEVERFGDFLFFLVWRERTRHTNRLLDVRIHPERSRTWTLGSQTLTSRFQKKIIARGNALKRRKTRWIKCQCIHKCFRSV